MLGRALSDIGMLTLWDQHATLVLESRVDWRAREAPAGFAARSPDPSASRDCVRHGLAFREVEQLHAALGKWLERQRPSVDKP